MLRFRDALDLVRRRTNGCLGTDGVDRVYLKFSKDKEHGNLTFVLKDDVPANQLTKLAVKYNHLFDDHLDSYTLKVLPATNYFQKDMETYTIWNHLDGFTI